MGRGRLPILEKENSDIPEEITSTSKPFNARIGKREGDQRNFDRDEGGHTPRRISIKHRILLGSPVGENSPRGLTRRVTQKYGPVTEQINSQTGKR